MRTSPRKGKTPDSSPPKLAKPKSGRSRRTEMRHSPQMPRQQLAIRWKNPLERRLEKSLIDWRQRDDSETKSEKHMKNPYTGKLNSKARCLVSRRPFSSTSKNFRPTFRSAGNLCGGSR